MAGKRAIEWNKATMALAIMGTVLLTEVVGYCVLMALNVTVPTEYVSFMYTTLTVLAAVAGAQYINGKTAHV